MTVEQEIERAEQKAYKLEREIKKIEDDLARMKSNLYSYRVVAYELNKKLSESNG